MVAMEGMKILSLLVCLPWDLYFEVWYFQHWGWAMNSGLTPDPRPYSVLIICQVYGHKLPKNAIKEAFLDIVGSGGSKWMDLGEIHPG